ncbi:MAG TPA: potassium channel family protein [Candidatus Acidoferrales bacterium]|nr:potassium channel family protein [Candidatus Acidoferrales bacterium]
MNTQSAIAAALGIVIVAVVLWDAFEAVVLPRRVTRKFRLSRFFYIFSWGIWSAIGRSMRPGKFREVYLSVFGPLSILVLLMTWALGMIFGFALIHAGVGGSVMASGEPMNFLLDLYLSGTTFFTLGLGDVLPRTTLDRVVAVIESGMGFGFLALIIGYLPILYQAFSRRELTISLLDARAGSPPTAAELLKRYGREEYRAAAVEVLREWERWSADVLESHLSYPLLVYYRSQHDNQSWLGAMTAILDTCALSIVAFEKQKTLQARLTFAMARHAVTDIAQALNAAPRPIEPDRLPLAQFKRLCAALAPAGIGFCGGGQPAAEAEKRLSEFRAMYEPYLNGLSLRLLLPLPPWISEEEAHYNWKTTAWQRRLEGAAPRAAFDPNDDHA